MLKKITFLISLLLLSISMNAQLGGEDEVYLSGDKTEAKFLGGGLNQFQNYVLEHLDLSKIEKEGQLVCSFTISETGELKNIRIIKDLGGESAFEMIRVLRAAPKWQPSTRNGKPFETTIKLPFNFKRSNVPAQQETKPGKPAAASGEKIYVAVEKPAEFPGGHPAFSEFFKSKFAAPNSKGLYKIMASVIIHPDGSLSDVKILRISKEISHLSDQAIAVIAGSPKWIPAQQSGKTVTMKYTIPITLKY